MERTLPLAAPIDQTFNIGSVMDTPLDDRDYQIPFPFTGKIRKVTIAVVEPKLSPEDRKRLAEAEAKAADAR